MKKKKGGRLGKGKIRQKFIMRERNPSHMLSSSPEGEEKGGKILRKDRSGKQGEGVYR